MHHAVTNPRVTIFNERRLFAKLQNYAGMIGPNVSLTDQSTKLRIKIIDPQLQISIRGG